MPLKNRNTLIAVVGSLLVTMGVLYIYSTYFYGPIHQDILKARTDIEDLKQAEDALRRREAYLAQAQVLSHTGSFGWNLSSGELYWSDETFDILGYKRTATPTLESVFEPVHPEDLALVRETLSRASQNGKGFDFEHRLLLPNGSIK